MPDSVPPSGPLARLRAQLAAPRGVRKIDALLALDDAKGAVAAMAPNEIFELVHEVGFEDASDLIALATPAQIQGCFDLDGWNKDEVDLLPLRPWLMALIDTGFENLSEVWGNLDAELRALILQREVKVYDVAMGEEPQAGVENPDGGYDEKPVMATPDRHFMLEFLGDEASQRVIQQIVEDLYRGDPDLARHTIMNARAELPSYLEEQSYRWRSGRLADLGYVDFYEALDLFRPIDIEQVKIGEATHDRGAPDEATVSLMVAEEVIKHSFLARAMGAIDDPAEAARLEGALMILVNKVLAAGRAKPGQQEVVRRGALYATATLSLGLETIARGDLGKAQQALLSIGLSRLFRVGYTVTLKLARLAQALAARSLTASSPARELVAGLCSPRPLFTRAADDPPASGVRPFESTADLRKAGEILTGLTLRVALVEALGVDVVAMGQAPEPRPALDDHIRTALARVMIVGSPARAHPSPSPPSSPSGTRLAELAGGGDLSGHALSQAELTALRDGAIKNGKLTSPAKLAAEAAIRKQLGSAQLAASGSLLGNLIDGWIADLEAILGGIVDAEIDPRFVEGVLVEIRRS